MYELKDRNSAKIRSYSLRMILIIVICAFLCMCLVVDSNQ